MILKVQQQNNDCYFFKLNNTFKLPKNFMIQLSGEYTSKTIRFRKVGGGGRMFFVALFALHQRKPFTANGARAFSA